MNNNTTTSTTYNIECFIPLGHGMGMILLNIISSIFGIVGNSLVCATIYTTSGLQTVSNYFLVSLAVADLIVTSIAQPLLVVLVSGSLTHTCFHTVELVFRLFSNVMSSASVVQLCFISIDRCLMVMKPYDFNKIMTRSRCCAMIAVSWILPSIYGILRLTISKKVTSLFTVFVMAICYVFIIASYALIVYQISKQQKLMRQRTQTFNVKSTSRRSGSRRGDLQRSVTITIGMVIVFFTVSWLPIMFLRSIRASDNSGTAYNWARTLVLCNSGVNPWIYCYRIPQFRAGYKRLLILCQWGRVKGSSLGDHTIHSESSPPIKLKSQTRSSTAAKPGNQVSSDSGKTIPSSQDELAVSTNTRDIAENCRSEINKGCDESLPGRDDITSDNEVAMEEHDQQVVVNNPNDEKEQKT